MSGDPGWPRLFLRRRRRGDCRQSARGHAAAVAVDFDLRGRAAGDDDVFGKLNAPAAVHDAVQRTLGQTRRALRMEKLIDELG